MGYPKAKDEGAENGALELGALAWLIQGRILCRMARVSYHPHGEMPY